MDKKYLPAKERWHISAIDKKPALKSPVLIVGLPGIGNVGKIVVDFLIDELKAKKLYEITSYHFPHTVFVGEDNLAHMVKTEVFYKKDKKQDFIFLTGDVQPTEQEPCYEFCDLILDLFQDMGGKEILTLGGIGLQEVRSVPTVFCTANSQRIVEAYKKGTKINPNLYGVVGPVMGVAGLLLGLGQQRNIPAIALLAETLAHPLYVGMKGSKEILLVLQKHFSFSFDANKLEKEISEYDKELMQTAQQMAEAQKQENLGGALGKEQHYIG